MRVPVRRLLFNARKHPREHLRQRAVDHRRVIDVAHARVVGGAFDVSRPRDELDA
jgi:hypothetical protein